MKKHLLTTVILSFIGLSSFGQIAYTFNGTNNTEIYSPDVKSQLSKLSQLTFEFWAKMTTLDNQSFANISLPGVGVNAGGFRYFDNKMSVSLENDYYGDTRSNNISGLTLNTWHHFAYVFNSGIWNFYLDGINIGTVVNGEGTTATYDYAGLSTTYLEFGKVQTPNSYPSPFTFSLTGSMDDIRVWNTARTATEIANNKNTELTGSETGLVLYYKLNETSGQVVVDSSPNHLNGTLGATSATESSDPTINQTGIVTSPVLPVNLIGFDLSQKTTGALSITWRTANENNNSYFEILKSGDGKNFEVLSTVTANTNHNYSIIDNNPLSGNSYYQLVQYDLDGKRTVLATKSIKSVFSDEVNLYPNPTADFVNINLGGADFNKATLTDVEGKMLQTREIEANITTVSFNLSSFPRAVYFVKLTGDKGVKTLKVLKK